MTLEGYHQLTTPVAIVLATCLELVPTQGRFLPWLALRPRVTGRVNLGATLGVAHWARPHPRHSHPKQEGVSQRQQTRCPEGILWPLSLATHDPPLGLVHERCPAASTDAGDRGQFGASMTVLHILL